MPERSWIARTARRTSRAVHRLRGGAGPAGRQLPQRRDLSRADHDGQRLRAECALLADPANAAAASRRSIIVTPRSACPKCKAPITALQNIPVVSWLALGGKCANCKAPISARYPLVELATGVLSGFIAWRFGFGIAGARRRWRSPGS